MHLGRYYDFPVMIWHLQHLVFRIEPILEVDLRNLIKDHRHEHPINFSARTF